MEGKGIERFWDFVARCPSHAGRGSSWQKAKAWQREELGAICKTVTPEVNLFPDEKDPWGRFWKKEVQKMGEKGPWGKGGTPIGKKLGGELKGGKKRETRKIGDLSGPRPKKATWRGDDASGEVVKGGGRKGWESCLQV